MDESSLLAAAFPFFFGAAAFPVGAAALRAVGFGAGASFLGSGAAFDQAVLLFDQGGVEIIDVQSAPHVLALTRFVLIVFSGEG